MGIDTEAAFFQKNVHTFFSRQIYLYFWGAIF
jgi:hypothetical protein